MRYRKLEANGDYVLGPNAFLANSPETVAQAVETRLKLWLGEWFVDTKDGTPWNEKVLGKRLPGKNPDAALKQRILGTPGVKQITSYSSSFNGDTREFSVAAALDTIYGATTIQVTQ